MQTAAGTVDLAGEVPDSLLVELDDVLEQLVQVADLMSCRLAALRGVDPLPVDRIEELKEGLARGRNQ